MELLSLVAAVCASVLVLASIVPGDVLRQRLAAGSVLLVAAVLSWYVGSRSWERLANLLEQRREHTAISSEQAAVFGGAALDQNTAFLDWASERIEPNERFYLFPSGPQSDPNAYQWATYQLLPRRAVDSPDEADALVFYNALPRLMTWDRAEFQPPELYHEVFAVARRKAAP